VKFSIVVPTYNEAGGIEKLIGELDRVFKTAGLDGEIIVVDDNSPDGTGRLADTLAQRFPGRVTVVHRPRKQGLGAALVGGFTHSLSGRHDYIFQMDADLSHDPASLPEMRRALENADVVVGSRYAAGGRTVHWPAWRRSLSRLGSRYAASVLRLPFRDLTSGYKGFRRKVLETLVLGEIRSSGYAFQIEVTYRSHRTGFRVVELPITFVDRARGKSKMSWRIVREALLVVPKLRWAAPH
jgi:dolichol-phosphate mannosyltransferase